MAWLDDRVWCHPKLADVSDRSFRIWISGMAYSSGFGTRGVLSAGHQRTIGSDARSRKELVGAGLWHETDDGIKINDWDEHNGKRDARRAADRERKRAARSSGTSAGQSAGQECVDGSEGSEGSEERSSTAQAGQIDLSDPEGLMKRLVLATGVRSKTDIDKITRTVVANKCSPGAMKLAINACTGPGVRDPLGVALSELKKRRAA